MKKKILIILNVFLVIIICLTGCGNSKLSEKEIVESLPDDLKTIYVNDELYVLDVDSLETQKRQTEEDYDTVYCTIVLNNENYKSTQECILYYSYYEEGGWLLDYWEITNSYTEAMNGITQQLADAELGLYYFDDYQFIEQSHDTDNNMSYTTYKVDFSSDNYSYDGNVILESNFSSDWCGGNWEHSLSYDEDFEWAAQGAWAGDSSDITGAMMKKFALELDIQSINQEDGTIDFSATEYYSGSRGDCYINETGNTNASIVMDYTGMDYLSSLSLRVVPDEQSQAELKYQAPTLSFAFSIKDSNYAVRIKPYELYVSASGFGGEIKGNLYKGYTINVWKNEFGWPQLEKKSLSDSETVRDVTLDYSNKDVESQVSFIREEYNNIVDAISKGRYQKKSLNNGGVAYYDDSELKSVVLPKNSDINYTQSYYYQDGKLMFAYYEGSDSHRFYFDEEQLMRWRYCKNAKKSSDAVNYDWDDSEQYNTWENIVLKNGNLYL